MNSSFIVRSSVMVTFVVHLSFGAVFAQDAGGETEKDLWRSYCDLVAHKFVIGEPGKPPFKREARAIFEHKNPFDRYEVGLIYVWKQNDGRPVALFTDLVRKIRNSDHWTEIWELHSLHDGPLDNTFAGKRVWAPSKAGLEWKPVSKSDPPARTAPGLRLQARSIVRRFAMDAVVLDEKYELRAISRPVYSYETKTEDGRLIGGSIVFFCRATDPEAFLVLEVQQTEEGLQWHYAPGNFTYGPTSLKLDGQMVWQENSRAREKFHNPRYHHFGAFLNSPFRLEQRVEQLKAESAAEPD